MFSRRTSATILAAASVVTLSGLVGAAPAMAKPGDVDVSGTCSAGSGWNLKLGARDGVIETEFEVDSNVVGQKWKIRMTDDGVSIFKGARVTVAPSGSFTIDIRPADMAGTDNFSVTAATRSTGETCTAAASI